MVGGGTAGWITALILQDSIRRLNLDAILSVVESRKIPTVGVDEATTAAFSAIPARSLVKPTEPAPMIATLNEGDMIFAILG